MYRLVKFSRLKVSKSQITTSQVSCKVCSVCGIKASLIPNLNPGIVKTNVLSTRQYETNTNIILNEEIRKRKRFSRNKRYFMELLEVAGGTSNQTKAPVRKLKAGDVSRIASNPDLKLNHFHELKKKSKKRKVVTKEIEAAESAKSLHSGRSIEESTSETIKDQFAASKSKTANSEAFTGEETYSCMDSKSEKCLTTENIMIKNPNELFKREGDEGFLAGIKEPFHNILDANVVSLSSVDSHFQESIAEEDEIHSEDLENDLTSSDTIHHILPKLTEEPPNRTMKWKKQTREKLAKEKISDLEKKCKEKAFNSNLHTYISLCVSCNFLHRGLATLRAYSHRSKISTKYPNITDIKIFEVLMRGFAAVGNQNKISELWQLLTSNRLKPSLDVFAASLECAIRSQKHNHQIPVVIKLLHDSGYELNDIFVNCTFLGDQREVVLKAIRQVEPGFQPVVPRPSICYSCSLLQEINEKQETNTNLRSPAEGLLSKPEMQNLAEDQFNNEFAFHLKVKSIEKKIQPEGELEFNRQKLDLMKTSWMKDLKTGFDRDLAILETIKRSPTINLLPYLKVLEPHSYIDIMMKEVQRIAEGSETFSPTTYQLYRHIGRQVRNRYIIKFKQTHGIVDKTKMLYDKYCDWYLNPLNNTRSCNGRQEWQQLLHEHQNGPSITGEEDYWPSSVLLSIGRFLYNIMISDVKIDVNILNKSNRQHLLPAFYRVYRQQGYKSMEEIKPHPVISKLFRAAGEEHLLFDIMLVPMLSPPLPWTSHQFGGYLMSKVDIMRLPDQALQQRQRLKTAPPPQLYPSLDSLNQLGSIPWKVNIPVLDTVIEVFNNGGSGKLDIPEPPHSSPVAEPINPSMTKEERFKAYRERMILRRQKAEMYSLWCDALYKLSLANHFRDKIFWLPHNMDFRGRVYPCPPHLNHLGADMSRSLLCFAQGKPIGPSGLDWLKIHLVNLLGTKKRNSIQERLDYANTIIPEILDSAEKPLTGMKWWMESETPWQTLACCMEIRAVLQHPGDPEQYVSHFPIHQDGSCNGLQHYAALGRDEAGACSVNLMPQDQPQDVYSCVAALVERERAKDAAAGMMVAKELDGFVRRKVIKQTVMTTVYGVTRFGARLQIAKQLKDINSFPKEYVWPASSYLVIKTFESLREMFTSTKEIQDWFTECAKLISQVCGQNMEYVTPLGLPVVQYYSRQVKKPDFRSSNLGVLQENFSMDMFERPNVMKQKNAFPPNFIHSLDSSHMMLTSIHSEQKGITFVSVHDCYWTHPSTVHIMNQICREQFVALHSQPILEDLSEYMLKRYDYDERERMDGNSTLALTKQRLHNVLSQVPRKGTFVLENVLDSVYFFS